MDIGSEIRIRKIKDLFLMRELFFLKTKYMGAMVLAKSRG